jgi:hypothetical protein
MTGERGMRRFAARWRVRADATRLAGALLTAAVLLGGSWARGASTSAAGAESAKAVPLDGPSPVTSFDAAHRAVLAWLDQRKVDSSTRDRANEIWAMPAAVDGGDVIERVGRTIALADENARKLLDWCAAAKPAAIAERPAWLFDAKTPKFERLNMRLWYGRWLAQRSMLDEALEALDGLRPDDVLEPGALAFYQAVVNYRLLHPDAGLEALDRLEESGQVPRRYQTLAKLMEADLKGLKEDSLDHIARRMDDIRRRLDLGHAGQRVRKVEDGVIASLDKLIKEMEDTQQQQQMAASGAGGKRSTRPASDSTPMGGKGPGEVTKKTIEGDTNWGNLPPKEREEAMQQIGREFPAHYREIIEQYFRKMAADGSDK